MTAKPKREAKKVRRLSRVETWPLTRLKEDPRNARLHPDDKAHMIDASLKRYGQVWPVLVQPNGTIIAGHWRAKRMRELGWTETNVLIAEGWSQADIQAYIVADNQLSTLSENDLPKLREQLSAMMGKEPDEGDLASIGFSQKQFDEMMNPVISTGVPGSLAAKFGVPPFSVMNAREGWWQDRKSLWIGLGIQSELGRGGELIPRGGAYDKGRKSNAAPGGSAMPSANYSKNKARGNGAGKPIPAKKVGEEQWGTKL